MVVQIGDQGMTGLQLHHHLSSTLLQHFRLKLLRMELLIMFKFVLLIQLEMVQQPLRLRELRMVVTQRVVQAVALPF